MLLLTFLLHSLDRYLLSVSYTACKLFNRSNLADVDHKIEFLRHVRLATQDGMSRLTGNHGLTKTCLGGQRICKFNVVRIFWSKPERFGDVNRSSRARFVLQAAQVGFDVTTIDLKLRLVRKSDFLRS